MTKPNGKPCYRCGINPRAGKGTLCVECRGTCRVCGNPTQQLANGSYRPYCSACRTVAEQQDTCSKCGGVRDGSHASYCRACYREYDRSRAGRIRKERTTFETTGVGDPDPGGERAKMRRHDLKRTYDLTVDGWDAMFEAQAGACDSCGTLEPGGRGRFHVDHNHITNRLRGLLCASCNTSIRHAKDDPVFLREKARQYLCQADYLERHAARHAAEPV